MESNDKDQMKVLMVVHAYYPADPRVKREAVALLDKGFDVDIVCLRENDERRYEKINGIGVYRLPVKRHRGSGFFVYLTEYLTFFFLAVLKITSLFIEKRYQVIQIHTLPDFLVFSALVPKLFGASVILDMHEVMPEFFSYRYGMPKEHPANRMIQLSEKLATAFADHVITVSETLKEILISRGVSADKITIIMNVADEKLFKPRVKTQAKQDGFALAYHGLLSDIYDLKVVFGALKTLKEKIPNLKFIVIGKGPQEAEYKNAVCKLGLESIVSFEGYMPQEKVITLLNNVDIGIVPLDKGEFTQIAFPTKIVEYIAMGIPVITVNRKTIRQYFNDDSLAFYEAGDAQSLADRILELYRQPERLNNLVKNASDCYKEINWSKMKNRYYQLIDNIAGGIK